MNMHELLDSISVASDAGIPVLGALVQYSVSDSTSCKASDLHLAMPSWVPQAILPGDMTHTQQITRAVQAFNKKRFKRSVEMRSVGRNGDYKVFSVLQFLDDDTNNTSSGVEIATVTFNWANAVNGTFDKHSRDIVVKQNFSIPFDPILDAQDIFDEIFPILDANIGAQQVRATITSTLMRELGAFRTRPAGGCYFIPCNELQRLAEFRNGLENLFSGPQGQDVAFTVLPILGDDRTRKDLTDEFQRRMCGDIDALSEKVKEFFADGKKRQDRAVRSRLREVDELRNTIFAYEAVLGSKLRNLTDNLKLIDDFIMEEQAKALLGDRGSKDDDAGNADEDSENSADSGHDSDSETPNAEGSGHGAEESGVEEIAEEITEEAVEKSDEDLARELLARVDQELRNGGGSTTDAVLELLNRVGARKASGPALASDPATPLTPADRGPVTGPIQGGQA
jgi:hypothetical protein